MSTLPPECEQLLISGYVLGNLSPAEALLFEEMLAENSALNERVTVMQQALDLAYTPPEISPPATLRDRLLTTANSQKANTEAEVTTSPKFKLPGSKILGAIAIAVIVALGIANYRLWQTIQTAKVETPKANQNSYLLRGEDLLATTTVKLVVNPNQLNATLIANNLPSLPPEKVYALWTVVGKDAPYTTDEKGAILTATFEVNQSGDLAQKILVPEPYLNSQAIDIIAITIEDKSAPQAHNGSILMSTGDELKTSKR